MNIALIGASGFIGSALLVEALARGHRVTALVTHPEKLQTQERLTATQTDVLNTTQLADLLRGHDAVISAFSGHAQQDIHGYYLRGFESILNACKEAGIDRLLVVGGAGSLEVAPGVHLLETPQFPPEWKASALGALDALKRLKQENTLQWTFLSPAALIEPGERTGHFRLGGDQLMVDRDGRSRISLEDYAIAMIDELEQPQHIQQRFSVAY
ncbi:NAD(P)-dependent oxidoreductase [Microbulbifer variabilis]|uniref:NAD(P)-dependent oxidoreductase n=1 Tax=Microbulbifer variabilis TaxID=266805 RepID=UPI00037FF70E|nr:NAD(P)H-binding protein [Microbulbifer variabilis]